MNDVQAVNKTPSVDIPKVTGPTVILQKPKPKISVKESAESFAQVSVSDKTENQSKDRTKNETQSVTSENGEEIPKNSKGTQQFSQSDSVDSKDVSSNVQVLDTSESVQKDSNAQVPVTVVPSSVSNGSEKDTLTPKKERFIPPLPRSASK